MDDIFKSIPVIIFHIMLTYLLTTCIIGLLILIKN